MIQNIETWNQSGLTDADSLGEMCESGKVCTGLYLKKSDLLFSNNSSPVPRFIYLPPIHPLIQSFNRGLGGLLGPHLINKEDEARGESSLLEDITQTEMGPEPETPGYQVRSADSIQQVFDREAC